MKPRARYRTVATVIAALAAALCVINMVLESFLPFGMSFVWAIVPLLLGAYCVVLGVLVAIRRPEHPVGVLLTMVGLAPPVGCTADVYRAVVAAHPGMLPVSSIAVTVYSGLWTLYYLPVAVLVLYFPDGRLPSPKWRWIVGGLLIDSVLVVLFAGWEPTAFPAPFEAVPHAFGRSSPGLWAVLGPLEIVTLFGMVALLAMAGWSLVVRGRRGSLVLRQQVRWLMVAATSVPLTLLLCFVSFLTLGTAALASFGLTAIFLFVPAAVTIAMLRHELYDVDRMLSTTITYAAASAVVVLVYAIVSPLAALAIGAHSTLAASLITAVCAAVLAPLRLGLQRHVDRRLYPMRAGLLDALDTLRHRTAEGRAAPEDLQQTLRTALKDPGLVVLYRIPGIDALCTADAAAYTSATDKAVPVLMGHRQIGALVPQRPTSLRLLREASVAAALLVELVQLRLVAADGRRVERHRMERDLHDTAQQRLLALGLSMRLAEQHVGSGSVPFHDFVDRSVAELADALEDLRRLTHGRRPSHLDHGLAEALRRLTESVAVPTSLHVDVGPVAEPVAAAVYFVAGEALANALKHARPQRIEMRVDMSGDQLSVRIADDGAGGAAARPGSGLTGLADRVAVLGGSLSVQSPSGQGTTIVAVIPHAGGSV